MQTDLVDIVFNHSFFSVLYQAVPLDAPMSVMD
jgi:hypothetical protein